MNIANKNLPVIAGIEINTDTEGRFNLNALHKASGTSTNKAPAQWLRTQSAKDLVQELTDVQKCTSPINAVKGGVNQGTFAHELLAIEYAGWISPKFRLMVNQTFLDFKAGKLAPVVIDPMVALNDPAVMRGLLLNYSEKILERDHQIAEMKPDIAALERIAKSDGAMCVTDAAKQLQIRPKALFDFLNENKWIYRRLGSPWIGYQDKIQQGLIEHKVTTITRTDGINETKTQVRITPKGIAKLAKMLSVEVAA
ncbi:MAG TPA: phage antirepressor KilAC domain-containing protein [Arsenophonus apicola]|uniref:phage antirepressor KilAC domain-containing protein n=1 Tax=Arsenophonus endosymbiont of Apis mellifera TaxID=1541805 RepID=UPI0015D6AF55|nr:phage antirepressor KilAC domain-containing protein [Arsenophonus endosymbiont of Apis mellifera]